MAALAVALRTGRYRAGPAPTADASGVIHVHGLGINPADDAVYAATHTGLFRLDRDGTATRVAERYQDTMGFTVVGPDRYLASGHPDMRDDQLREAGKPPLLGLIESQDAGRTWSPRSLLGDADLHTIVAIGDLVVAYDSTGERVLVSVDGGYGWETRSQLALVDLAVDPNDPAHMAAVGTDGLAQASWDGGRSWVPEPGSPVGLNVLRWHDEGGLWAGTSDGAVLRRPAAGAAWELVRRFEGSIEAIAVDGAHLYAAVEGAGIYQSGDAGRRWDELYRLDQ